ncbi:cytochrome P450, partial [Mycobacterium kansasii]
MTPLFTKAAMKRYHDDMLNAVRELLDAWTVKSRVKGWITVPADANRLTIEMIARTAIGHSFNDLSDVRQRESPFVAMLLR